MIITILFFILAAVVFFKMIGFFIRTAFGLGKLVISVAFWPAVFLLYYFLVFGFLLAV